VVENELREIDRGEKCRGGTEIDKKCAEGFELLRRKEYIQMLLHT
jgi:hypothetical protein